MRGYTMRSFLGKAPHETLQVWMIEQRSGYIRGGYAVQSDDNTVKSRHQVQMVGMLVAGQVACIGILAILGNVRADHMPQIVDAMKFVTLSSPVALLAAWLRSRR
jgi:hypothetical protein